MSQVTMIAPIGCSLMEQSKGLMTFVQSDEVTLPDQKDLCDVVTFETLITIQTIENLNS